MKQLFLFLPIFILLGCSSESYDCHMITEDHTFIETKLCDGLCSPMFKITDVKKSINEKHFIVKRGDLDRFIKSQYYASDMLNAMHPDFTRQMGYKPNKILKLDCKKI